MRTMSHHTGIGEPEVDQNQQPGICTLLIQIVYVLRFGNMEYRDNFYLPGLIENLFTEIAQLALNQICRALFLYVLGQVPSAVSLQRSADILVTGFRV